MFRFLFCILLCLAGSLSAQVAEVEEQSSDEYEREWSQKCDVELAKWRANRSAMTEDEVYWLIACARRAERPEVIEEIAAGGEVAKLEIALAEPRKVSLKILRTLGEMPMQPYEDEKACVIRRITADRVEVWNPKRGWLFDAKGKLLNTAKPPRRDGAGREWYGAFAADGSWITTDLWDWDCTVTFFSPKGRWKKELTSAQLAPTIDHLGRPAREIISWARVDRHGTGWVIAVGSEGGREIVHVQADGSVRALARQKPSDKGSFCPEAWELCYPRDLKAKFGDYGLTIVADDGKGWLQRGEPAHGEGVGFPNYSWAGGASGLVIPNRDYNFGFLPRSRRMFIGANSFEWIDDETGVDKFKTWFFRPDSTCLGWIRATYLSDAADQAGVWMMDDGYLVTELDRELKATGRMQFSHGRAKVKPVKVFPDLRLGFFEVNGELTLARW